MFKRTIESELLRYAKFPVVAILGPRQSGKTTVARRTFANHTYVNFENPDVRERVLADPRNFLRLNENPHGIIIDEFQNIPEILSYIQTESDEKKRPGYFVLTGSQNFLINEAISQSLAGRVALLTLLPLSLHELAENKILPKDPDELLFTGGYPRIYQENITPDELYPFYVQTYIERDVRQLVHVGDVNAFQKFLKLCAGRVGQQLNLSELASACGISATTAHRWISLLEACYIIFLLQPYFKNYNKRLTKTPKLYFYDTGLACSLLGIESPRALALSSFRGSLFECLIIADLQKQYFNAGKRPASYYWRDLNGRIEVDCLLDHGIALSSIEIKSGETLSSGLFAGLEAWNELSQTPTENNFLVYGGTEEQKRTRAHVLGWPQAGDLLKIIQKNLVLPDPHSSE